MCFERAVCRGNDEASLLLAALGKLQTNPAFVKAAGSTLLIFAELMFLLYLAGVTVHCAQLAAAAAARLYVSTTNY